jgi:hypothetical protein
MATKSKKAVLLSDSAFTSGVKRACSSREEGAVLVQTLLVDARLHFLQTGTVTRINELHAAMSARDAMMVRRYLSSYAGEVLAYSKKENVITVKEGARRTQFAVLKGRWDEVNENIEKSLADLMKIAKRLYSKASSASSKKVTSMADARKVAKCLAPLFTA